MQYYHTPKLLSYLYNKHAVWHVNAKDKTLYLTFDDGPTPGITDWILDLLDVYQAKATFFCVGDNVSKYPEIYQRIMDKGHAVGNHTFNHLNGWKTETAMYGNNIIEAAELIESKLFRPPYGRMKKSQIKLVNELGYKTIMWSVLTNDFNTTLNKDEAWKNISKYTKPGGILVFHDHKKAFENLKVLLPKTLEHYKKLGFSFRKLD